MLRHHLSVLVASIIFVSNVSATPILVGTWDFIGSGGSAAEIVHATGAINTYNSSNEPDLPLLSTTTSFVVQAGTNGYITGGNDKTVTWTASGDYDFYYVLSKYGQGKASFDSALHYVLAGDILQYNPGGSLAPNGLSHVSIWGGREEVTNVPDGGSILAMLGVTGLGLMALRRKLS